ncbi:MAG: 4Fe-4S binding protein [Syntrophorhabdus sp.]|jgi:ferredoxin|nr:4Fe-4S binding protein [Syntrophorhabdus sp.]MDI9557542.1 4Fe-4S binding protein [Pseudomonadota bacterium]OPX99641.1 MAG: Ferredoxin-2 [Syntrophorhabdus sp. PtaB.Bin027]OQB77782.1 MAG: Ferredoxin-2 [Deltaproteobacteria bacterium ADurb.Bin135]HNQ64308.1 4Fe-4S binding protein [Syntrophorhabdaceae bacterium]
MIPIIDEYMCIGCGKCIEVCPPQALILTNERAHLREEFCEECGFCAPECPVNAIIIPFPLSTD